MTNCLEKRINTKSLNEKLNKKSQSLYLMSRKCRSCEEILHENDDSFEQFQFKDKLEKKTFSAPYGRQKKQKEIIRSHSACSSPTSLKSRNLINFNEHLSKKKIYNDSQKNNKYINENSLKSFKDCGLSILWEHLLEELSVIEFNEMKEETELINFLLVPKELEKVLLFGWFICLDTILYFFTISPLRFLKVLYKVFINNFLILKNSAIEKKNLKSSEKIDLFEGFLILGTCIILQKLDASRIYHNIRGQATIKLYVIYNVLEVGDRLFSAFGHDVVDFFFSKIFKNHSTKRHYLNLILYFILALITNVLHSTMLFYQIMTLNVTVNSYSNALLTLLISSQFVEIKGTVFKKFEKENVFQMTLADIAERFQLSLILTIVLFRNLMEIYGLNFNFSSLLTSLLHFSSCSVFFVTISPILLVMGSEMIVDWFKHVFVIKFNHIHSSVYRQFISVLSSYYINCINKKNIYKQSYYISRKIGLPILPLTCLTIRAFFKMWKIFYPIRLSINSRISSDTFLKYAFFLFKDNFFTIFYGTFIVILFFLCLIVIKLVLNITLIKFSYNYYNKITENKDILKIKKSIHNDQQEIDEKIKLYTNNIQNNFKDKGQKHTLYTLERYSMISKRIY